MLKKEYKIIGKAHIHTNPSTAAKWSVSVLTAHKNISPCWMTVFNCKTKTEAHKIKIAINRGDWVGNLSDDPLVNRQDGYFQVKGRTLTSAS